MKTLSGPLAERQRAAQERVNQAVEAMDAAFEAMDAAGRNVAEATDENRDDRQAAFEAAADQFDAAEREVFAAEKDARTVERMATARAKVVDVPARQAKPGEARVVDGEVTYRKFEGRADNWQDPTFHYLRDLYRAQCKSDPEAVKRLMQHAQEAALEGRANQGSTTDGSGGEFVPPLWLQDEWIGVPRPGRPAAALIQNRPLPPGTDSINLPKITTGTQVATMTEATGNPASQSLVTTSVTAVLQTKAGQVDVSQQLIDRSNPTIDAILFDDLAAAYDVQIDTEVLNGTVTNGKGFLQLSGTVTSTYTSGSPTVAGLYPKGADILQQIATNVFMPGSAWLMHPRRWAFFLAALDTQSRPLIVPSDAPGFNQMGVAEALGVPAENVAGSWHGLPVVLDASIPTNLGAGTNEDRIIGLRARNCYLFEDGTPRTRAHEQVLDNTLQVRLQLYNYFALMNGRLPASVGVISGTGLAAPVF